MITDFKGKTAVLTGAGSGFGLECARIGAQARAEQFISLVRTVAANDKCVQ